MSSSSPLINHPILDVDILMKGKQKGEKVRKKRLPVLCNHDANAVLFMPVLAPRIKEKKRNLAHSRLIQQDSPATRKIDCS